MARRPAPTEYAGWFDRYIRLVEDVDDLGETMARQLDETMAWYRGLSESQERGALRPRQVDDQGSDRPYGRH